MKYYVSITVKSSTTRLGELLTTSVLYRYDGALLTKKQAEKIPLFLEKKIASLCEENKRLKPMTVKVNGNFVSGSVTIHTVTENGAKAFEDNRPFTMYLYPVRRDHTTDVAAWREYDDDVVMGNTFDLLKSSRYGIFATLGTVRALEENKTLKATAEAIEAAIVEIGKTATNKPATNDDRGPDN